MRDDGWSRDVLDAHMERSAEDVDVVVLNVNIRVLNLIQKLYQKEHSKGNTAMMCWCGRTWFSATQRDGKQLNRHRNDLRETYYYTHYISM